jgi:hypothetical protein
MDSSVSRERRNLVSAHVSLHFNWPVYSDYSLVTHAQKPVFVFRLNGRVHVLRQGVTVGVWAAALWAGSLQYLHFHFVYSPSRFGLLTRGRLIAGKVFATYLTLKFVHFVHTFCGIQTITQIMSLKRV